MRRLFLMAGVIVILGLETVQSAGKVYLVLGSDTAIWQGMSTSSYHCTYNPALYTDPAENGYAVMDPAFRTQLVDSYGRVMPLTWWMMAGNIFRYATNTDMPIPNIMTMYLMKKYHGKHIAQYGDELSLHYHTFAWTDYSGNGYYWWNQATTFMECYDDFNLTLSQFLLEEQIFPVSFRSGWHFMDNDWQHYLDDYILPYSMHNTTTKHTDDEEPLDNNYDWSQSPKQFVPYRPSRENYQIPGNGKGWNLKSVHFNSARYSDTLDEVFRLAQGGLDQVVCLWGHLPETDFVENIAILDSLAHKAEQKYPEVKFRYCTAIEAMQLYRETQDTIAPVIEFTETPVGDELFFTVTSDEPIFQIQPFIAAKTVYEEYHVLPCTPIGENAWQTTEGIAAAEIAKVGVALCDTLGNQSFEIKRYLPDDRFIDDEDPAYSELSGGWQRSNQAAWGTTARYTGLHPQLVSSARWQYTVPKTHHYHIWVQVPETILPADTCNFMVFVDGLSVDTTRFQRGIPPYEWLHLHTLELSEESQLQVVIQADGVHQAGKTIAVDVVKISPLVPERQLSLSSNIINYGEVSQDDTVTVEIDFANHGYQTLTIDGYRSREEYAWLEAPVPITIDPMQTVTIPVRFHCTSMGTVIDTVYIHSNDSAGPVQKLAYTALVRSYFRAIDNDDEALYSEVGTWHNSVTQIYGNSSRYAWLTQWRSVSATFETDLTRGGDYEFFEIVPKTVNSTNHTVYILFLDDTVLDSVIIDQNEGSGDWVSLGTYYIPPHSHIAIKVIDVGKNTQPGGAVLRADAVKATLLQEYATAIDSRENLLPRQFQLYQNYPNPFNSSTRIRFDVPEQSDVRIEIYDLRGFVVEQLFQGTQKPGKYEFEWNPHNLPSGIYLVRMNASRFQAVRKTILYK